MPCTSPLSAWFNGTTKNKKQAITFKKPEGRESSDLKIPCGQCLECRLERARQWAVRCVHENSLHEDSCFITLTYNKETIPEDFGLRKSDFQGFMKRFRRMLDRKYKGKKIKYYMCGEYGAKNLRPHYHALIFGHDFYDRLSIGKSYCDSEIYYSDELYDLWKVRRNGVLLPAGTHVIGDVTFESAAYIARYCTKVVTGPDAKKAYERVDPETGEIYDVIPEYTAMSRGGKYRKGEKCGIGAGWISKYANETFRDDSVVINGKPMLPPNYYDSFCEDIAKIKEARIRRIMEKPENYNRERRAARHKMNVARMRLIKRKIEND